MNVFRDRFKAFKLHRVVFEFSDKELDAAVFTEVEEGVLSRKATTDREKLDKAYTIACGVLRAQEIF